MNMLPNVDFLQKLTATFLVEAREHLQVLGAELLKLEQESTRESQMPLLERLFREAHSLKGAARAVNAQEIERCCQALESTTGALKSGKSQLSGEATAGLHRAITEVGRLIDALEAPPQPGASPKVAAATHLTEEPQGVPKPSASNRSGGADTVRVSAKRLDAIFEQAEALLGVNLAQVERASELRTISGLLSEHERLWTETLPLVRNLRQRVESRRGGAQQAAGDDEVLELAARLLAYLDHDRESLEAVCSRVTELSRVMAGDHHHLDAISDHLLEDVKLAMMMPFETLLAGFPKMVRDMAYDLGKEVEFHMHGGDVKIDKRILQAIKDPLLHLIRNCIDHGIETPFQRTSSGKRSCGSVTLAVTQTGGRVVIEVVDDGGGINLKAVKTAAVAAGVIEASEVAVLDDHEVMQLVLRSGITTREQVTTLSGRGLGMAIVEENVADLNGSVSIESTPGGGTTVRLGLPLTLATLRGTVVHVANRELIIPTASIIRVVRITRASIRQVENNDSICLDGTTLALVHLADVLGLVTGQPMGGGSAQLIVMVLGSGSLRMAFAVDQIVGEQEVLAKPLGRLLRRVRNVASATVLGTGRVVPILNVPDLLQGSSGIAQTRGSAAGPEAARRERRLLVVDDSITARTLLQNILESAGYSVKTAPNGAAAFTMLLGETFDLLVSDVEMPRMNGFELTKRIRAEARLASLPVVLVTALEATDDRERGIDAGANAYIVKGGFDQSNLLEVIQKLI